LRAAANVGLLIAATLIVNSSSWTGSGTIATAAPTSWNPAVSCVPVVTTIQAIVGTQKNANGGATQAGGWYGGQTIPSKTSLAPPCTVNGAPMLVELHDVNVEGMTCNSFSGDDGDCWGNLWDNSADTMTLLNQIHVEIAGTWITAGIAPSVPATNTQIDIQGFVFWDDGHLGDAWHSFSGWELHPVSAWRRTTTNDFSMSVSPSSGAVTAGSSTPSTISTAVTGGNTQQVSLSITGLPTGATASFNPSSISTGSSSVLTLAASSSTPVGTYPLLVRASGSAAVHTVPYTLTVNPAALTTITNGGFEAGSLSGWSTSGTASVTGSGPHSGAFAALVGASSPTNGDSSVAQSFSAPSGGGTLTFWYNITCPDAVAYDWATATLQDNTTGTTAVLLPHTCPSSATWKSVASTLVGGHYYTIYLTDHDDNYAGDATFTKYDDVSIQAATVSLTAPTGLVASAVSQSQISLGWNAVSGATGYRVERSADGSTGWLSVATPTAAGYTDGGLTAGTAYFYRVFATNSSGASPASSVVSATTLPNPPPAPGGVSATAVGQTEIDVAWTDVSGETGYRVERSSDGVSGWTAIASPAANVTGYQDLSVPAGSTRYYRVFAVNSGGDSPASAVVSATTVPGTPTGLVASAVSQSQISLGWNAVSGATGYRVERSADGSTGWLSVATPTAAGYTDGGLTAGTAYFYRVFATNSSGASPASSVVSATTVPATPGGLSATAGSANDITLQWSDVAGEVGFRLERSTDGTTWGTLANLGAGVLTYTDTGLTAGSTYFYRISSVGTGGSSPPSAPASATAVGAQLTAPTGLVASAVSQSQISLGWSAVSGATGYRVERSADGSTGWLSVATPTATGYTDGGLTAGTAYFYRVFATNSSGASPASSVASATTLPNPPPAPANPAAAAISPTQITVTWSDAAGATGFDVQRSPNGIDTWATVGSTGQGVVTFTDGGLSSATTYYYRIVATNSGGSSAPSTVVSATTQQTTPSAPQSPRAAALSSSSISVMWTGVANASSYQVQRSADGVGGWSTVATVGQAANTTTDTGLSASTSYWYRIIATNASGSSPPSAVVSATTTVPSCPCTVWSPTTTPTVAAAGDATANELGMKFRADVSGTVTGVRFYKGSTNTGTHTGHLWSRTGTLLASATFTGESASGWQQVSFGTPVAVTAGTTYVVSYFAPSGHYAVDQNYFATKGVDAAPLHALANGIDGADGVYKQGSIGFPTLTYRSSNYWVDVVFAASAPSAPTGVMATAQPAQQITVSWNSVPGATSYAIAYSSDGSTGWTVVGSTVANTTTWVDIAPRIGVQNFYRLVAINWGGSSQPSTVVSAIPTS